MRRMYRNPRALAIQGMLCISVSWGQPLEPLSSKPAFEVVSIRPSPPDDTSVLLQFTPRGFSAKGVTLRRLTRYAYNLRDFQVVGGPSWFDTTRFHIEAITDEPARDRRRDELRLQSLLTERFGLSAHRETKTQRVYLLRVGSRGVRMAKYAGTVQPDRNSGQVALNLGRIVCRNTGMPFFATALSRQLERQVIDETGLMDTYDFEIEFEPETSNENPAPRDSTPHKPSIFAAIQEQLGLKLDAGRAPVPLLVVDRAKQPEAN